MPSVIVSACRTPIGGFLGELSPLTAPELGACAIREAVARAGVPPSEVGEVLFGNVVSAGVGQAPARQAALRADIPASVAALTLNKVCGSGLAAVVLADRGIRAGDLRVVVAGGMESMSGAPYLLPRARQGYRLGHAQLVDAVVHDGLWDAYHDYHMGCTGELCAREQGVSRAQQDAFAARSYERALHAQESGAFDREIVPVDVPGRVPRPGGTRRGPVVVSRDEEPRPTTLEALARLRPVFEEGGTITAGNSSSLGDGAAAVCLMEAEEAARRGLRPLATLVASAVHSREPERVMMAPEGAIKKCLARARWQDADLYEINEPFAAAAVALIEALHLDPDRVNVHGGAVALGHPLGATGCRILVTLLYAMERRGARTGIAALCLGGGEAVALAVEREP